MGAFPAVAAAASLPVAVAAPEPVAVAAAVPQADVVSPLLVVAAPLAALSLAVAAAVTPATQQPWDL